MKRNDNSKDVPLYSSALILNKQNYNYDNDDENPIRSNIETISMEKKIDTTIQKNITSIENLNHENYDNVTFRIRSFLRLYRSYLWFIILLIPLYYRALSRNEAYYNHQHSMTGKSLSKKSNSMDQKKEMLWENPEFTMRTSNAVNDLRAFYSTKIPDAIQKSFSNVDMPFTEEDVPLFLHLPRSGGSTIKDIMRVCLQMVEASDIGAIMGQLNRPNETSRTTLQIINAKDGYSYLNVDTYTYTGIDHAKKLELIESGLAGFIAIEHLYAFPLLVPIEDSQTSKKDTSDNNNKKSKSDKQNAKSTGSKVKENTKVPMNHKQKYGRMFAMMRHPMDRIASAFYYYGKAHWETHYDPELAHISFEMYAKQNRIEHNWMVRVLTHQDDKYNLQPINRTHLMEAKEVLRRKCLIGLLSEKEQSMKRFEIYFGWNYKDPKSRMCQEQFTNWDWSGKNPHPSLIEGTTAWNAVYEKNQLDIELYEYAKQLFREQSRYFHFHDGQILGLSQGWNHNIH